MRQFISERALQSPQSEIRKMFNIAATMEDVISLGIGEPDYDTPDHITEAAYKAAKEGATHYTANAGYLHVREALAKQAEQDYGISCDPAKEIIITTGAMGALYLGIMATINPGDEVLIQDPSWPNYFSQIRLAGGVPVLVPVTEENGFRLQASDMEKFITEKTKAILITTPNNPTGAILAEDDLVQIADLAKKYDLLIYADEVYAKLIFDDNKHISIATLPGMKERVITITSYSKTYAMTGWRVGYAIANEDIITNMVRMQENVVACASSVSQYAALTAATGPQDCIAEMAKDYGKRSKLLVEGINELPGMSCIQPEGTIFLFPNIRDLGKSSSDVAHEFLTKGKVVTVPGTGFGPSGEGHLRLSCATSEEKIIEALKRMKRVIEGM